MQTHSEAFAHGSQLIGSHPFRVRSGGALTIALDDGGELAPVYGQGGGCTLHVEGDAEAIFIPLRGSIVVTTPGVSSRARAGQVLVSELDDGIEAVGYADALWIALLGGERAWARKLDGAGLTRAPGAQLLPARHLASHDLRRHAIALARATAEPVLESAANAVIDGVVALQSPLYELVARCPGRTHAKRVKVFLRLQRIRKMISDRCDQELDNVALARMANYSPCHFLSTFKHVFRETPHAYLVGQRLRRARLLLHSSDLAINEVALACGFRNRSAFSRLFRQKFGTSAKEARVEDRHTGRTDSWQGARPRGWDKTHHAGPELGM